MADVSIADSVEVPEVPVPTLPNGYQELSEIIDPLKESDWYRHIHRNTRVYLEQNII